MAELGFRPMEEFDVAGKRVLLRVDINSPIDPDTKKIVNTNRIDKSLPTISWLLDKGARLALIAHQGDTLDYQNLIPLAEHAQKLSEKLGRKVDYIDDVCGPAAQERVKKLKDGEAILLGNLRYLCEEISTFENAVKLKPEEMLDTYLVRSLAPLFDLYVNDAFAAAHRNAPSMVAFQELLPAAAGPLFFNEVSALTKVLKTPVHPSVYVLGGAKISDAFGMMEQVLASGAADKILACGVTGAVMLIASGVNLGAATDKFLSDRSLDVFIEPARRYLQEYPGRIVMPVDLAYEENGQRKELDVAALPKEQLFMDLGEKSIEIYEKEIAAAGMVFVNGPAGVFERDIFENGTRRLWEAIAAAPGYTVVGGGDSVNAAAKFTNLKDYSYVCTAGGAMVRFLSGKKLPLIAAMEKAGKK
ncbi:MAG: phosphoglycerate kinase [Spirochaetia bacterium]